MTQSAITWAFAQVHIRNPARAVLVALADQADERGECSPSIRMIADRTGLGLTAVHAALKTLVDLGAIAITPVADARGSRSNVYRLSRVALFNAGHVAQDSAVRVYVKEDREPPQDVVVSVRVTDAGEPPAGEVRPRERPALVFHTIQDRQGNS